MANNQFSAFHTVQGKQFSPLLVSLDAIFHYIGLKCDMFGIVYTQLKISGGEGASKRKQTVETCVCLRTFGSFVLGAFIRFIGVGLNFRFASISLSHSFFFSYSLSFLCQQFCVFRICLPFFPLPA